VIWPVLFAAVLGAGVASVRWLRIAQREHYLPPAVTRFAWRWWNTSTVNQVLGAAAVLGVAASFFIESALAWLGLLAVVGPIGLPWRGVSSPLAWTSRLQRLAAITAGLVALLVAWSVLIRHPGPAMASVVALPRLIDAASALAMPIERRLADKWVGRAKTRLRDSGARVVAITGSFGKTTTKGYLAHLLSGSMSVVVTPASFNNRLGIARAINEHLVAGTDVFVAEMGTYGAGEIAELCEIAPPEVAVITSIGPVHLERFGSEERISRAKGEILAKAPVAVLNVDNQWLRGLAEGFHGRVIACSLIEQQADVAVIDQRVFASGQEIGAISPDVFAINVACAIGSALALGMNPAAIGRRIGDLPAAPHRRNTSLSERGVTIIDDTYNSNTEGAKAALKTLVALSGNGRRVVVSPGMVELGSKQNEANREWAALAATQATDLVVVGRTNRSALLDGAKGRRALVTVVDTRTEAVNWVRANLEPGDAVLYENDLPDHYP
jgi:UDP-N-acetylmuramoyl-tripeptide--D-alanyl-D-alanine ligase